MPLATAADDLLPSAETLINEVLASSSKIPSSHCPFISKGMRAAQDLNVPTGTAKKVVANGRAAAEAAKSSSEKLSKFEVSAQALSYCMWPATMLLP